MKITIIGCGWLGLPLLRSLVGAGHPVCGTGRTEATLKAITAANAKAFRVVLPDNFFAVAFRDQDLLIVTLPPGGRQLGPHATQSYLAKFAPLGPLIASPAGPHVLYTSSTGVYGATAGAVDERTAVAPDTHSARAVVAAERWLAGQTDRLTVLRLAGLIGPDRHPGNFYGGRSTPVKNADAPVNLVHRDDAIAAVRTLLAAHLPTGNFNVCAAAHPTKGDFYAAAAQTLGKRLAGRQAGGLDGKTVTSDKLRALGWTPQWDELTGW